MGLSESESDYTDLRSDPPIIADLDMLEAVPNIHLGNGVYVHAVDRLPDGRYIAYLGVSLPTDTSAGAGRAELTFLNYAPVGAAYARPIERDGDRYYAVDLPDRDALNDAFCARESRENDERAAVIPQVVNEFERWADRHVDRVDDARNPERAAMHRGMALAFETARREVVVRRDVHHRGDHRWSKADRRDPVDLDNTEESA